MHRSAKRIKDRHANMNTVHTKHFGNFGGEAVTNASTRSLARHLVQGPLLIGRFGRAVAAAQISPRSEQLSCGSRRLRQESNWLRERVPRSPHERTQERTNAGFMWRQNVPRAHELLDYC